MDKQQISNLSHIHQAYRDNRLVILLVLEFQETLAFQLGMN